MHFTFEEKSDLKKVYGIQKTVIVQKFVLTQTNNDIKI